MTARGLEVHRHAYVRGPNAGWSPCREVVHSHEGGDRPHEHPDTGPATYTIDKDEWLRATGLIGGGRKKFTKKPTGPQLAIVDLEDWQRSYDLIIIGPPSTDATGGGEFAVERLRQACKILPSRIIDGSASPRRRRAS